MTGPDDYTEARDIGSEENAVPQTDIEPSSPNMLIVPFLPLAEAFIREQLLKRSRRSGRDVMMDMMTVAPMLPSITPKSLREWWHDIMRQRGRFACYGFLLLLPGDDAALEYLKENSVELSLVTGRDCLFLVILDQFQTMTVEMSAEDESGMPTKAEVWRNAIKDYASEGHVIDVANLFGVDYDDFPCLLLFEDIRSQEYIIIRLKGMALIQIRDTMRHLFSIVRKAAVNSESPLARLEKELRTEMFKERGRNATSHLKTLAGKTLDKIMEAFVKATIS